MFENYDPAGEGDEEEVEVEQLSPIAIRISTSVHVSKDYNVVSLSATPSEQANAVAGAVLRVLKENSSARCGIPMIDEEGRPRPVKIEIDAGMVVTGSGNVIGSEVVVGEIIRRKAAVRIAASNPYKE
jgi:hypothetical protein